MQIKPLPSQRLPKTLALYLSRIKIMILLIFLASFLLPSQSSAQISIDGNPIDWTNFGNHYQDAFGNGVVDSQYTQGSKDFLTAFDQRWEVGQTKAKNDIANGASSIVNQVSYIDPVTGQMVLSPLGSYLVFAGDRTSNNGDAQIGFWFYLNGTHPVDDNGVKRFAPEHARGDLLVLADFTGGGRTGTVNVYRWIGGGAVTPGQTVVPNSDGNLETTGIAGTVAENNNSTYAPPSNWRFLPRDYETNEFYEGYINLTVNSPGQTCFASVLLETRSSQSITAALDDFIGGTLGGVPTVTVNSGTRCANGPGVLLTATPTPPGTYTYDWTVPLGAVDPGNQASFTATIAGDYSVVVTNTNNCSSEPGVGTVTVNPVPGCDITGNNVICAGGSTSFLASGGASYSWTGPGGFTAATASTGTITAAGLYTVVVTSAAGCTSTCGRTLTVNSLPVCEITGNNIICAGGSTSFLASGGASYSWTGPGGFTAATASTGTITAAGLYTVVVTSAAGCTSTCGRTLTVNPLPVCEITGNNVICAGGSTSFLASGGASYSWTGPGGFTAATASTGTITAAGLYTVVVTSAAGCTSTCGRTLTVNSLPVCEITGNNIICAGGSTSFLASGGASYSWTGPGGFTAATASTGTITAAGLYTVVVTSAAGCTSTCGRTLTVNPLPVCEITGNNVICAGGSTSFLASGGASYSWTGPGGFTAATASTGTITAAGLYTVVVTSAAGCTSTCGRTLTVNSLPVCGITGNNIICAGGSTSFLASGGASYSWTGPGGFTAATASTGTITAAGLYTVVVTSAAGCTSTCGRTLTVNPLPVCEITGNNVICAGGSTSFLASGGASYSWTGPGGFTAATASTGTITAAGLYTVVVTSAAGCTSTCSRTLTVNLLPVCEITGNNIICAGGSTSFLASGGTTFAWTGPGGFTAATASTGSITVAGLYTVTVSSGAGCTSTCSRTLTVNPLPVCGITGNNVICAGGSTSFLASGGASYSWTGPGGFTAATASTGTITAAGLYTVVVTSAAGCTSSCSRTLTVNPLPVCEITGNNVICAGGSTSFLASGGASYSWTGPGGFTAATASTGTISAAGLYTVVVTSAAGCTSTCSRTLTVNPLPGCSITGNNLICAGGSASFLASGGATGASYSWTGPGGFTAGTASTGTITAAGVYTVVVTNTTGCTSTCTRTLTVVQNPIIYVPVATPFCAGNPAKGSVTLPGSQLTVNYTLLNDAALPVPGQPVIAGTGGPLTWTGLDAGGYLVRATGAGPTNCANLTAPAVVIENPLPTPVADDKEICLGDCVTLTATPAGGVWSGAGVTGSQFCSTGLSVGTHTVTYTVTNLLTGCQNSDQAVITVKNCSAQICTYTQGYYGNDGGKSCDGTVDGLSTAGLIEQSLGNWNGTLTIGKTGHSVVIMNNALDIECVIEKMPGGGASKELLAADYGICNLPASYLKNGRINNTLLSQTIALGLNVGITNPSTLGSFGLQAGVLATAKPEGGCGSNVPMTRVCVYNTEAPYQLLSVTNEYTYRTISTAIYNAITPKTVGGLLELANNALANTDNIAGSENGVSLSEIAGAVGAINEVFDECRIFIGWNVAACAPFQSPSFIVNRTPATVTDDFSSVSAVKKTEELVTKLNVTAYPNPFTDKVRFEIKSAVSGKGTLEVYNMTGQKLSTVYTGQVFAGKGQVIEFKVSPAHKTNMIYILKVGGQQVVGKLININ